MLTSLSVELRSDLDLLASCEQENNRDARDSCHLCLIEDAHEFLHETKRQVGVFDAVNSESTPSELIAVLQFSDHTVVYVLFLLAQEVSRDRVERVGPEFVLSKYDLKHVKLNASFNVDVLCVTSSQGFRTERSQLAFRNGVFEATELCKAILF